MRRDSSTSGRAGGLQGEEEVRVVVGDVDKDQSDHDQNRDPRPRRSRLYNCGLEKAARICGVTDVNYYKSLVAYDTSESTVQRKRSYISASSESSVHIESVWYPQWVKRDSACAESTAETTESHPNQAPFRQQK